MIDNPPDLKLLWNQYKPAIISLTLLSAFYFLIRLPNLTVLPIFADEAIYIRWAQVMRAEPTLRFISLQDGKQPLFMWLMIPFLKIISDPLIAGRLLSILSGFGSLIGLFFLTFQLTKSQKHALIASFLYAITPFTFFFDRMALVDSLLTMFFIWAVYFAIRLIKHSDFSFSFLTGVTIGAAWLTKSPAIILLILLPFTLLIHPHFTHHPILNLLSNFFSPKLKFLNRRPTKITQKQLYQTSWYLIKILFFWFITTAIAFIIYNILRLGPEFHQIVLRNQDYIYPLNEILSHPLLPLRQNFIHSIGFLWSLLTPSILIAALIGIILMFNKYRHQVIFLLIWLLIPFLFQVIFARSITARYLLFIIPTLHIFASYTFLMLLNNYKNYLIKSIIFTILLLPSMIFNLLLLINPSAAPLPRIERKGYLEEWTAGTGLREIARYLQRESNAQTIVVGTEGFFGTMPDGLQIYFDKNPRVTVIGQQPIVEHISQQLYDSLPQNKVYFIVNSTRFKINQPENVGLHLIKAFPKAQRPDGFQEQLLFFELTRLPSPQTNPI